ncbi:MAG TPA: YceI family protein [Polyangiaceae bacterium]|nr:YceI family protein [Polyangiaceae bacterium]
MFFNSHENLVLKAALIVAGCLACSSTNEKVDGAPASATTPTLPESNVTFSMSKWMDEAGTQKIPVTGWFSEVSVKLPPGLDLGDSATMLGTQVEVVVDTSSIETGNALRNENITLAYFESAQAGPASIAFTVSQVEPDAEGGWRVSGDATLTLRGISASLGEALLHVEEAGESLHVRTLQPLEIRSETFAMPVSALLQRCGHLGIDPAAFVEADLLVPLDDDQGEDDDDQGENMDN